MSAKLEVQFVEDSDCDLLDGNQGFQVKVVMEQALERDSTPELVMQAKMPDGSLRNGNVAYFSREIATSESGVKFHPTPQRWLGSCCRRLTVGESGYVALLGGAIASNSELVEMLAEWRSY